MCWGWNEFGQSSVPASLRAVTGMDGGIAHSLAVRPDGSVVCWGSNGYGQCTAPADLGVVTAVAAGELTFPRC